MGRLQLRVARAAELKITLVFLSHGQWGSTWLSMFRHPNSRSNRSRWGRLPTRWPIFSFRHRSGEVSPSRACDVPCIRRLWTLLTALQTYRLDRYPSGDHPPTASSRLMSRTDRLGSTSILNFLLLFCLAEAMNFLDVFLDEEIGALS